MTNTVQYVDAQKGPAFTFPRELVETLTREELAEVGKAVFAAYDAKLMELGYLVSTSGRVVKEA